MLKKISCFLLSFLFFVKLGFAAETIDLRAYLGKDAMTKALLELELLKEKEEKQIELDLQSDRGDLAEVLRFAKALYSYREESGCVLKVHLNELVLGPAAVLAFLADELSFTSFLSWGDIFLSSEEDFPLNLLRSQLHSFFSPKLSVEKAAQLSLIANAMMDSSLELYFNGSLQLERGGKLISPKNERLVLDQNLVSTLSLGKLLNKKATVSAKLELDSLAQDPAKVKERLAALLPFEKAKLKLGRILIDDRQGGITQSTWIYLRRALDHYKKIGVDGILLELNTPGGEVFAAQRMSDALKDFDREENIPVIAYINNWAISAGAMLAYSCRFIALAKDASMGAAEPVFQSNEGMKTAPEKINSALRADMANRASYFGRDPLLAEAMVDKDLFLVLRHGKIIKLDAEEDLHKSGPYPDEIIIRKGKLLTLDSKKLIDYGVADMLLSEKELFSHAYFSTLEALEFEDYQMDWQERFLAFLANPLLSSLLMLGLMLGFYTEFSSPGFGLPGLTGLTCLFFIVLSTYAMEAIGSLHIIMLFTGFLLLFIEFFLLPGTLFLALVGSVLIFLGLVFLLLPGIEQFSFDFSAQTWNPAAQDVFDRLTYLSFSFALGIFSMALLSFYIFPKFRFLNALVLETKEEVLEPSAVLSIGMEGLVLAPLRPSGKVDFQGELYDCLSDGGFIPKGVKVKLKALEGNRIIVEGLVD